MAIKEMYLYASSQTDKSSVHYKFIDMKSEIKELIKSFKSKKKNGRDRYNEFLYYCFMAYDDKVKPKLPDKVRNKYIIMRDSMLKYLIANEQEVIDQLSK